MPVVADSSVLIDFLIGSAAPALEQAFADASVVLSPLVVAEVLSGDLSVSQRESVGEMLQDYPMHATPLEHWINVGSLRRLLRSHGINATIPDAHVAQCAIDLGALLLTRDDVFLQIASRTALRLDQLR